MTHFPETSATAKRPIICAGEGGRGKGEPAELPHNPLREAALEQEQPFSPQARTLFRLTFSEHSLNPNGPCA